MATDGFTHFFIIIFFYIISRDTTTCCLPQATTSDVNRELQNILVRLKIDSSLMWGKMVFIKSSQNSLRRISMNFLKHFQKYIHRHSSVDHSKQEEQAGFHGCLGSTHGCKKPAI